MMRSAFVLLFWSSLARAGEPRPTPTSPNHGLDRLAHDYAARNDLQIRPVSLNGVRRLFVPVVRSTMPAFFQTFQARNGAIVLRPPGGYDVEHRSLVLSPQEEYDFMSYGKPRALALRADGLVHAPGSHFVAMALEPELMSGLRDWLTAWNHPKDSIGFCMSWLLNATVGQERTLWHAVGVSRSAATSNLVRKLIHNGNERVPVVGVYANTSAEFERMSDEELKGPPPGLQPGHGMGGWVPSRRQPSSALLRSKSAGSGPAAGVSDDADVAPRAGRARRSASGSARAVGTSIDEI